MLISHTNTADTEHSVWVFICLLSCPLVSPTTAPQHRPEGAACSLLRAQSQTTRSHTSFIASNPPPWDKPRESHYTERHVSAHHLPMAWTHLLERERERRQGIPKTMFQFAFLLYQWCGCLCSVFNGSILDFKQQFRQMAIFVVTFSVNELSYWNNYWQTYYWGWKCIIFMFLLGTIHNDIDHNNFYYKCTSVTFNL